MIMLPNRKLPHQKPKATSTNPVDQIVLLSGLFILLAAGLFFLTTSLNSPPVPILNTLTDPDMIVPSPAAIDGYWKATNGNFQAEVLLTGNMYHILFIQDPKDPVRRYTRGFFTYDEKAGKLTLTPDLRAGAPDPSPGIVYKTMTTEPFDVYVFKKKFAAEIFWAPPQDMVKGHQIHPLFYYMIIDGPLILTWTPMTLKTKL